MAAKAHKIAATVAAGNEQRSGESTIAALEARTTPETLRAARPAGLKTGTATNYSGQYLYDRFIANDREEVTKMDLVRDMAANVELGVFKAAVAEFVSIAKSYADKAVEADKAAGIYDEKKPSAAVLNANAKLKTAKNHQTVLRIGYGAIRYASEQLAERGYDAASTGYQTMRVIGLAALAAAGVNWDGSKAESKEAKAARGATKTEAEALTEVMQTTPKNEGESRADYFARIDEAVQNVVKAKQAEEHTKLVKKLVDDFRAKAGALLPEVLDQLALIEQAEAAPL